MTLKAFAKKIKKDYPVPGCYIAVMRNGINYDLEVEVDENTIGGVYATEAIHLEQARKMADKLEAELMALGIRVLPTRNDWIGYLESVAMEME